MFASAHFIGLLAIIVAVNAQMGEDEKPYKYLAVAIARLSSAVNSINDIRDKRSCHAGAVNDPAGWDMPLSLLAKKKMMTVAACHDDLKNAHQYFSGSCAPGYWANDVYKRGNYSDKLCSLCANTQQCTESDSNHGAEGAISCLRNKGGDIAFTTDAVLAGIQDIGDSDQFRLVCTDDTSGGTNQPLSQVENCNWGRYPTHHIMTYQSHGQKKAIGDSLAELYFSAKGTNQQFVTALLASNDNDNPSDSNGNKLPEKLSLVVREQTLDDFLILISDYLSDPFIDANEKDYCPSSNNEKEISICTMASKQDKQQCEDLRDALAVQYVMPSIKCVENIDFKSCLTGVGSEGGTDYAIMDAGWAYQGGKWQHTRPVMKEMYGGQDQFKSVLVVKSTRSGNFNIHGLKNKKVCAPFIGSAAGWLQPGRLLRDVGHFSLPDCQLDEKMAAFFSGGCVPGATNGNLVNHCLNGGMMTHDEQYFGFAGAFRGLVEDACDVAFLKDTTVDENVDGRNQDDWAKNLIKSDYKYLCRDGGVRDTGADCNAGVTPSNRLLTFDQKSYEDRWIMIDLLKTAHDYYYTTTKDSGEFQLYGSPCNTTDTMFTDSTTELGELASNATWYEDFRYFDNGEFVRALNETDPDDCRAPYEHAVCCFRSPVTKCNGVLGVTYSGYRVMSNGSAKRKANTN
ncbi:PREDICTED: melanotransferrin-like [Priapulus caudatus]|uniref:Melanotransferrin-like n=1 Tax=Priapulus caudatus TaxID=37621 RepID=A0ABM1EJJ8_PRICU|nr:PREDICTED: melanotransferrin-like [Priapulus caudatus]